MIKYQKEKYKWIETDPEWIQMLELTAKDIEIVFIYCIPFNEILK